ncbi:MAG: 50S ribosomal protein L44e [Candidatus Parvarchaeota archaeon]|nr:50S ribosomal protein L44e [Candidatus Jingweiarchaeum tengchongense]MCW1298592.1 50S ribosomal protein L44e [Candidatus Jingweiarchaeum tengchongense]MCW1300438.1 50S ribosomal protein L44e [Candidatus Jingweiarchaeum tengchongense]MCW1304616.1 50S ribosomal protein L44e [Candidatus Jingweiarchaeum tengchongense]MCW1306006.1 50S ribosomal protein L44e [Candidatus Jingweiarchaeum tengchongense]
MKIPKQIKRYCPYCRKHTLHKVIQVKSGKKRSSLSKGQRRFKKIMKGYGGFPRPKMEKGSKYGAKVTKKLDLRFKCTVCNKTHTQKYGRRTKKFELV